MATQSVHCEVMIGYLYNTETYFDLQMYTSDICYAPRNKVLSYLTMLCQPTD